MFCGISVKEAAAKKNFRVVNQKPSKLITETQKLRDSESAFPLEFNKNSSLSTRLRFDLMHSTRIENFSTQMLFIARSQRTAKIFAGIKLM
jgi:hypothetical protein